MYRNAISVLLVRLSLVLFLCCAQKTQRVHAFDYSDYDTFIDELGIKHNRTLPKWSISVRSSIAPLSSKDISDLSLYIGIGYTLRSTVTQYYLDKEYTHPYYSRYYTGLGLLYKYILAAEKLSNPGAHSDKEHKLLRADIKRKHPPCLQPIREGIFLECLYTRENYKRPYDSTPEWKIKSNGAMLNLSYSSVYHIGIGGGLAWLDICPVSRNEKDVANTQSGGQLSPMWMFTIGAELDFCDAFSFCFGGRVIQYFNSYALIEIGNKGVIQSVKSTSADRFITPDIYCGVRYFFT